MLAFRNAKDFNVQEHHCYGFLDRILNVVFDPWSFVINPQGRRPESDTVINTRMVDFIVLDINARDCLFMEVKKGGSSRQQVRHQLRQAIDLAFPQGDNALFGVTACGTKFWFWECYGPTYNIVVPGAGVAGHANDQPPGFVLMLPGEAYDGSPGCCDE